MNVVLAMMLSMTLAAPASKGATSQPNEPSLPGKGELEKLSARYKPVDLKVDLKGLSTGDKEALKSLIEASRILNDLFLEQKWAQNRQELAKLERDTSPTGKARLAYFWLNRGPWSTLDDHKAFLPGVPSSQPEGGNYYPEDMMKGEFERWVAEQSPEEQAKSKGYFHVIRRDRIGKLIAVPYSTEYAKWLVPMAALFKEAAAKTENETLKRFLTLRAEAFASNDYVPSDLAWMDLDAPLEIAFGPYETYGDQLFGYKAAFESYITRRDDETSARLAAIASHLQEIENNLPAPEALRNPKLGASAPIRVVNVIFNAGDASEGVQTAAFNLPNDERVVSQRGSKRVMLKNVQEAKYKQVLLPISEVVLGKSERKHVSFDPFFMHILTHEVCHGLGLHEIAIDGKKSSPRAQLIELYGAIEEARADVLGLYALQHLMEVAAADAAKGTNEAKLKGVVAYGQDAERKLYTTFLVSAFRSLRFGANEAHAKGMALQLDHYIAEKGVVQAKDGTWQVDLPKMKGAVRSLASKLIAIHSTGDRAGAEKLLKEHAIIGEKVAKTIAKLDKVPIDIAPRFVTAQELVPGCADAAPLEREERELQEESK